MHGTNLTTRGFQIRVFKKLAQNLRAKKYIQSALEINES